MNTLLRISTVVGVLVIASSARIAAAQTADELIDRGLDMRERGDDEGALRIIEQAYAQQPSPRAAAQLGMVEQALARWAEAEQHLVEGMRATDDPWITQNRAALERALEAVSQNLGSIEITTAEPGATLELAGVVRATTPLAVPLRVSVGLVEIVVGASGYRPQTVTFSVEPGQRLSEAVVLERESPQPTTMHAVADPTTTPAPPDESHGPTIFWSWLLLGGAVAALTTTIALGATAQSQYDGLATTCAPRCSDDQIASVGDLSTATNVMIGVTAAIAAGTVTAFIVEATSGSSHVQIGLGPTSVVLRGAF